MAKKDEALVKQEDASLANLESMITTSRPEGADEGILGNEGIGEDDILLPRIGLAQKTSPELDPTSPRYMEGVQFTNLFGSLSGKNYKQGPIFFSVLRRDDPRFVELIPVAEGGGVRNPKVPPTLPDGTINPLTQFGEIDPATGRSKKPIATMFYDFICLILNDIDFNDPVENVTALSFKSSALKVAKQLNMYINQRGPKKIYKGVYELRSGSETKGGNTYAVYKVKNAGWLKPDSDIEKLAGAMFESWKTREANIDVTTEQTREPGADDFDTAAMDAQTAPTTEM